MIDKFGIPLTEPDCALETERMKGDRERIFMKLCGKITFKNTCIRLEFPMLECLVFTEGQKKRARGRNTGVHNATLVDSFWEDWLKYLLLCCCDSVNDSVVKDVKINSSQVLRFGTCCPLLVGSIGLFTHNFSGGMDICRLLSIYIEIVARFLQWRILDRLQFKIPLGRVGLDVNASIWFAYRYLLIGGFDDLHRTRSMLDGENDNIVLYTTGKILNLVDVLTIYPEGAFKVEFFSASVHFVGIYNSDIFKPDNESIKQWCNCGYCIHAIQLFLND